ncbi:enoyl-CoA hydratase [Notoacmeibacter marinus]|uniref:Enoyl-CoA hydratase n=1 Tax=Notoacmeibacter marinus TaxID=1876515 RepID=A0A231V3P8_9HYPH|nr:crotonase/enoyl-CoA hydratase family protein [Notoacmeibacter marinus]OXT02812.1 enoyl-CoA hydratase [Notoacmeibacter marinus]
MSEKLLYQQAGHVVTLTLNAPETRNVITDRDMMDAVAEGFERAEADQSVRCIVLTGAGKAFSSGGNLRHMKDKTSIFGGTTLDVRDGYRSGIQRMVRTVWNCEVPIIAAVNGPAFGAGCDLTAFCDIRIASTTAVFAENFVRVGIISGDGGAWVWPRQIGLSRAAEMLFTGEPIDAQTALEWGLVSSVVEPDELMEKAYALAERIAYNPPRQLRLSKRLLRQAMTARLDDILELSAIYQGACHQTDDHAEAVDALLEKRDASFSGQ